MNEVIIEGRLGGDPEIKMTASGRKVTTFNLATNSRKAGKEETIWWRINVWGERYDKMIQHLKKGSSLRVIGEMSINEWVDREGNKRFSLEVNSHHIQFPTFSRPLESDNNDRQNNNIDQNDSNKVSNDDIPFDDDQMPF